ncbi:hypothetical protein N7532_002481 [Penicillium argentinense]|uniref:Store-operated calcium entry-associated regulatory factor n=1 Tax=Penicillium argentinense TaxID=1131581 RepID=A0A9W9G0L8_9EURO|nr:uncharacterized protein N7532_002481 [Penicillium argentinense]KAJ5109836.1 hypothetical protein N7532_002481 [Penicillium argentinense]
MRYSYAALTAAFASLLLASPATCKSTAKPPGKNAIQLSTVQALTLRADRMTSSRRVSPIPQLTCVGPPKVCDLYKIESMRCNNEGHDYDEEDVQWTCKAQLPPEFKLGSTDVVCEGYRSSEDPWVLKGSCGVEYRMLLTEEGERRFGKYYGQSTEPLWKPTKAKTGRLFQKLLAWAGELIFLGFFIAVFAIIFSPLIAALFGYRTQPRDGGPRRGWGGFWGGSGGGGDDGFYPGPPPPYSNNHCSPGYERTGWRPGFWSGILGGAAAGYQMGRNSNRGRSYQFGRFNDPGEGSSRRSPPRFSTTTTGTGLGSTRRR